MKSDPARAKLKPWKEHASHMMTFYSVVSAMVGVFVAVIPTDQKVTHYWPWPVGLLGLSFFCFLMSMEKHLDALDEDDIDKYLAWLLGYNLGVVAMFFGIASYILLHYCLHGWRPWWIIFSFAFIASSKWINDFFWLLGAPEKEYAKYKNELVGIGKPEKEPGRTTRLHGWIRKVVRNLCG